MDVRHIEPNVLDRVIGFFSPKSAYQRSLFRMQQDAAFRTYDAASRGRRVKNWNPTGASANKETERNLPMLRARSRDLTRNNAYGKRAIQAISTNTIGSGIRPRPTGLSTDTTFETLIKTLFSDWADSTDCDFDGRANFYGLQRLAMRCIAESGEVLIRRRRNKNMAVPLQIQLLEPDFLDHHKNTPIKGGAGSNGNYSIQGVEFNKEGKRIGYWLFPAHPGEGMAMQSQLVSAEEVLHVFYIERVGQVRGVPFSTTSSISLYDFDEYEQAQLIRQKVAACFAAFVTDPSGDIVAQPDSEKQEIDKIEPGMIQTLSAGKQITFATPPPVQNYNEYSTSMLRKIAVGFGVSYEVLSGDLSNVNFSSGRMGWIEMGRLVSEWQNLMLVPLMCDPIWKWFIEAALISGKINRKNIKATWTPPRREMIDPVKEIKGMSEAIRNGLHSWSDSVRQLGQDPDDVLNEIIADNKRFEDNEIMLDCNPKDDAARKPDLEQDGTDVEELTGAQMKKQKKNL